MRRRRHRQRRQPEAEFTAMVLRLARLHGWATFHVRPARTARGWRTPVQGDGVGWPDLVLVRERVLFRELKTDAGRLRPGQAAWLELLRAAGQDAAVWRPRDWATIERTLGGDS